MGSGCSVSNNTANMFQRGTADTQVRYTGPAIPALNICTGDTLAEIEAVILEKIIEYSTGEGIFIENIDLTTCNAFADCVSADCCAASSNRYELPDLLDCFKNSICSIYTDVETIKDQLDDLFNASYNTSCIPGVTGTSTFREILQAWMIDYCTLKATVTALQTQVNNLVTNLPSTIGTFLLTALSSCTGTGSLIKSGSGASAAITFKGFVPVGSIMPYGGSMAKFDSTGLGLTGTDMCGWALANGNNGTVNMIGQVPIGMINGMGGSIPSNYSGGPTTSMGDQIGEANHLNTAAESGTGAHTHPVTDPGHDHFLRFKNRKSSFNTNAGANNYVDFSASTPVLPDYTGWAGSGGVGFSSDGTPIAAKIGSAGTGISIGSASSPATAAHNNIQPATALAYIQRIN